MILRHVTCYIKVQTNSSVRQNIPSVTMKSVTFLICGLIGKLHVFVNFVKSFQISSVFVQNTDKPTTHRQIILNWYRNSFHRRTDDNDNDNEKHRNVQAKNTWWRHQMETFSASLTLCAGNSPVAGEFPAQSPVTRSFDGFFGLRLNKRLSEQSWGWWFEM